MSNTSKHQQISKALVEEITAGKYQRTGRLPSEAQLVARFGVSRPTAARALRDLQEQGLIERRAGSGTFVREGGLVNSQRQLGLLVPELGGTEIFELICGDLARLARVHDFGLLWGNGDDDERSRLSGQDAAEALCEQYIQRNVNGVFFAPFEKLDNRDELNVRLADRLRQAGIGVVLLDRDLHPFPLRSEYDLVGVDNFAGGYELAAHLLKLGCKRLKFLAPPHSAPTITLRVAGAQTAINNLSSFSTSDFVYENDPDDPKLMQKLRGRTPVDAVICANDRIAASLIQAAGRADVKVPQQLAIVGFDDVKYASLLSVPLTTMRQPCREIAAVAFRAMMDALEERNLPPRSYVLPARLIVRESCGAYVR